MNESPVHLLTFPQPNPSITCSPRRLYCPPSKYHHHHLTAVLHSTGLRLNNHSITLYIKYYEPILPWRQLRDPTPLQEALCFGSSPIALDDIEEREILVYEIQPEEMRTVKIKTLKRKYLCKYSHLLRLHISTLTSLFRAPGRCAEI